ncbi:hypothetical protein LQ938_05895 [Microbacterium sp. cx-55]|uniref:hypothetical protein n=1 Tax=Microbacterium sp. cx-55 TaxID=2875948 RepID=UPI001CC128C6|nr:hypothetical protein [Microbacterium sp. cx-55]MBZ4486726.1 hypothetical protein [Microbacterium sp. cx-55]UGB36315.1 hypothetical protein LQ938_05895 [Microbacterium sp. cx-55]
MSKTLLVYPPGGTVTLPVTLLSTGTYVVDLWIESPGNIVETSGELTFPTVCPPTPTPAPTPSPTTAPGSTFTAQLSMSVAVAGGKVTVTASGLEGSEPVQLWLHSAPVQLWSDTASDAGTLTQTITIPEGTALGSHQIEVRGATSGSVRLNLTVSEGLAATGSNDVLIGSLSIGAAALLAAGGLALLLARRTRQHRAI